MERYPNIYGDLSAGSGANSISRDKEFGRGFLLRRQDRLMFGTDYLQPGQPVPQFELFDSLKLPAAVEAKVFRKNAERVEQHAWDQSDVGCLLLYTAHEVMLDDLLERPIESGDLLSNANTVILMGKTRDGNSMGRALHIAKHRGSACDERIVPYTIDEHGLQLQ